MNKLKLGKKNYMYPSPVVLVGTENKGIPNYITVTYCSLISLDPAMIMISLSKKQYSRQTIFETKKFSVNIPSQDMAELVDYCGLVSGRNVNKSQLFTNFYGDLGVPMIFECPVNLECHLQDIVELDGTNTIFIGKIIESFSSENYLTKSHPDISKIKPIMFSIYDFKYWALGSYIGKACSIGKNKYE